MACRFLTAIVLAMTVAACGSSAGTTAPSAAAPTTSPTAKPSTAPTPSPSAAEPAEPPLQLVAVGDSILFNSPDDCPGCKSALTQYAIALEAATGRDVAVQNLTEHSGLQLSGLLHELEGDATRKDALASADAIVVGIAHNDAAMNRDDDPCDGAGGEFPDWSKFTEDCIAADVAAYTPKYDRAYGLIAAMREGKPTILRTINRYNDWIGWPGHDLPAEGITATRAVVTAWNDMICATAEANGFTCADISVKFNGEDGTQPAGDLLAADYTHPSQKGNDVIAQVLIDLGFEPLASAP
jgi:lysophospholipase L1-like esterase